MIIYGPPGSGKTTYVLGGDIQNKKYVPDTSILAIPEALPICYLDFDHNVGPIRHNVNRLEDDLSNIEPDKINLLRFYLESDLAKLIKEVNRLEALLKAISQTDEINTVIVDSTTTYSQLLMSYSLGTTPVVGNESRIRATTPARADYQTVGGMVSKHIGDLMSSRKNVILISHDETIEDKKGNVVGIIPMIVGKQSKKLVSAKATHIGYVEVDAYGKRSVFFNEDKGIHQLKEAIAPGIDKPLPKSFRFADLKNIFTEDY